MRDNAYIEMSDSIYWSTFRITCEYIEFNSLCPYDMSKEDTKTGTGFLAHMPHIPLQKWGNQNVIITNHHVISNHINVRALINGKMFPLIVMGYNPNSDVAILCGEDKIMQIPGYNIGNSSSLKPGDTISTIGFASGTLRSHTTTGTVSGRSDWPHSRIQCDVVVNPGNSGGPILDKCMKNVLGVVTSGMDDMQVTNFFVGIDEVKLCCTRILNRYNEAGGKIGIDMGFELDAVVSGVDAAACQESSTSTMNGGALVLETMGHVGLQKNDVILEVESSSGKMIKLDAYMRVRDCGIWKYDDLDFRSILGRLCNSGVSTKWNMQIRRDGATMDVLTHVGSLQMKSRVLIPDCQPVRYATFGGVVIQMLSITHVTEYNITTSIEDPGAKINSFPTITHIAAGSPFSVHGTNVLLGGVITMIVDEKGKKHNITTLNDINVATKLRPIVFHCKHGVRVGSTVQDFDKYEANISEDALARGIHDVSMIRDF